MSLRGRETAVGEFLNLLWLRPSALRRRAGPPPHGACRPCSRHGYLENGDSETAATYTLVSTAKMDEGQREERGIGKVLTAGTLLDGG